MTTTYDLDGLMDRLYGGLKLKQTKSKLSLEPPSVAYVNRKTVFSNFRVLCMKLQRNENDVKAYFDSELGCSSSVDASGTLIITGRYNQKNIESIMTNYMRQYVTCGSCKSYNTELKKENRILFIICNRCYAKRSC